MNNVHVSKIKEKLGLLHIYCGDGKGKTSTAMGLALPKSVSKGI